MTLKIKSNERNSRGTRCTAQQYGGERYFTI